MKPTIAQTGQAGHGPNIGHGFVKYIVIDQAGRELAPVVFPAQIAKVGAHVSGSLVKSAQVAVAGVSYWTGDDATQSQHVITRLAQERLADPAFIPALLAGALGRLGSLNGSAAGVCVAGLPATWAQDKAKCQQLGERLRAGYSHYSRIKVIAEPLGLVYSQLLDGAGEIATDQGLAESRIAVVDIGHLTVDTAIINRLAPEAAGLDTFNLGTSRPLAEIRAALGAAFDVELSLHDTDMAIRRQALRVGGRDQALPAGWDSPLIEHGETIATRLQERWGKGHQFEAILVGGGGAEVEPLVAAIERKFANALRIEKPQTAIARGYARLARRLGRG